MGVMVTRITLELHRLQRLTQQNGLGALWHELFKKPHPTGLIKLFRYFFVALVAYVFDFGILVGLTSGFGVYYLVAATLSFTVGVTINYLLSRRWVFPDSKYSRKTEMAGVLLIGLVGLILNTILLAAFTDLLGIFYVYSKIIATIIVFFWNFFARRTFLKPAEQSSL